MTRKVSYAGARKKGAAYQREIANRWRDSGLWPLAQSSIAQTRGGASEPDVIGTGEHWHELKHHAKISPLAALRQAEENIAGWHKRNGSDTKWTPVAVCRQNRMGDIVVMRLADYESLVAIKHACLVSADA